MLRLIAFIAVFSIFLVFIVFNLDNKSDISFGFKTLSQIPVFLTVFASFALGMLFAVPFTIPFGKKRKKPLPAEPKAQDAKKGWWKKKKAPQGAAPAKDGALLSAPANEIKKESGPYGID